MLKLLNALEPIDMDIVFGILFLVFFIVTWALVKGCSNSGGDV